jgi:hypothetical protein
MPAPRHQHLRRRARASDRLAHVQPPFFEQRPAADDDLLAAGRRDDPLAGSILELLRLDDGEGQRRRFLQDRPGQGMLGGSFRHGGGFDHLFQCHA